MQKWVPIAIVAGILIVAGLGYVAAKVIGSIGEKTVEKIIENAANNNGEDADVDIDSDGGTVRIETDEGSATYGATSVPEDFPRAVPLPTGGTVASSYSAEADGKQTYSLIYTMTGEAQTVGQTYQAQLEQAGFTIKDSASISVGQTIFGFSATKDTYEVSATATGDASDADATALTIVVVVNNN